jgi:hypothetical protein
MGWLCTRRSLMRRLPWVIVPAVFLAATVVFGVTAYKMASNAESGSGPVTCDYSHCIPALKAASVIEALQKQGHVCSNTTDWVCDLSIGFTAYRLRLETHVGLVGEIYATIMAPDGWEATGPAKSYLEWIACLPFGDDPATMSDIKHWLTGHLNDGKSTKAKIGGYSYEMDSSKQSYLIFSLRTVIPA